MNAPNDRPPGDGDLERLLADDGGDLTALYRRLSKAEPPRRLDRSVIGAAARAAHGYTPRRQRWMIGLGSAAGLVLAAGVAWHAGQDALRSEQQLTTPVAAPAEAARPAYIPVAPISEPARRARDQAFAQESAAVPAPAAAPAAKPAAAPRKDEAMAKAASKPAVTREESRPEPVIVGAPAPPPPAVSQPSPAADAERAPPAPAANAGGIGAAGNDAQSVARPRGSAAPSPRESVELQRDLQLDPQAWLARIDDLLRAGRRQQAIESLRLFRSAHPDYPLPDELRALL